MIVPITHENIPSAAYVHAEAWRASHSDICSPEFVAAHTTQRQTEYLRDELAKGKALWMLLDPLPVGLVSVDHDVIENLYVLPEKQGRGYGTTLLHFAMAQCSRPSLWVLSSNKGAYRLYSREGFVLSGRTKLLNNTLLEHEMVYSPTGGI